MMRLLLLIAMWLSCVPVTASGLPSWAKPEAARAYAEAALIEMSSTYPVLDLTRLNSQPAVLAREGSGGDKVVLVVYESSRGSYVVTLVVDADRVLRVFSRGAQIDPPHKVISDFYAPGFDASSLLQEG